MTAKNQGTAISVFLVFLVYELCVVPGPVVA